MNTKGIKFLAVLAVLAMAFAAFAAIAQASQDDAATDPNDIADFDGNVDFTGIVSTGTKVVSNTGLDNVLGVKKESKTLSGKTYMEYTVSGFFGYTGGNELVTDLYGGAQSNALVFNLTKTAGDSVWKSTDGTTWTTDLSPSSQFSDDDDVKEPMMFTMNALGTSDLIYWYGVGPTGDDVSTPSKFVKITVKATNGTPASIKGTNSNYDVVTSSSTGYESTKDYSIVKSSATVSKTVANATSNLEVLKFKGTLLVAPGAKLTVQMKGDAIGASYHADGIGPSATGAITIKGIQSTGKDKPMIEVIDQVASYAGTGSTTYSHCIGGGTSGVAISIEDVKLTTTNTKGHGVGIVSNSNGITIINSDVTINSDNRGIYAGGAIDIKKNSNVTVSAKEAGIITANGTKLTIGGDVTVTKDETKVTANITAGAADPAGNKAKAGLVRLQLDVKANASLTTEGAVILNGSAVAGSMTVKYDENGGYKTTADGTTTIWVPAGLVVSAFGSDGKLTTAGTMTVTGELEVKKGAAILGTIGSDDTHIVTFGALSGTPTTVAPSYIVTNSDVTITHGSVKINGNLVSAVNGVITVAGAATVEISGVLDANLTLGAAAHLIVPAGETLTISNGKTITVTDGTGTTDLTTITVVGDINGTGQIVGDAAPANIAIYTANPDSLSSIVSSDLQEMISTEPAAVDLMETAGTALTINTAVLQSTVQDKINNNLLCYLSADLTIAAGYELTIPESSTINLNGHKIILAAATGGAVAADFMVDGGKIVSYDNGNNYGSTPVIEVSGIMEIDSADVCVDVKIITDPTTYQPIGYVAIINAKNMKITGELTSDVSVGYGNTMTLEDVTVPNAKKVEAFGKLIFEGTTDVKKGANVYVYAYGSSVVNGTVNIAGAMNIKSSLTNNGTINLANDNGGATLTVASLASITNMGALNINAPMSATAANSNIFTGGTVYNYGTMKITGKATGTIYNLGELTFNGTAGTSFTTAGETTTVILTDGVTFNLTSAIGNLIVKDDTSLVSHPDAYDINGAIKKKVRISSGNTVQLLNAKNITFTETVKVTINEAKWTEGGVTETTNIKSIASNLELTGNFSAIDDKSALYTTTISVSGNNTWVKNPAGSISGVPSSVTAARASIGDAAVGKNVQLDLGAYTKVTGTLNVVAKNSLINATSADSRVAVSGTIIVGYECGKTAAETGGAAIVQGILYNTNSVYYVIQDADANSTYYYTTFAKAVAVTGAYENSFVVLGSNSISSGDLVIPAGYTFTLYDSASVTVGAKATLEVKDTGLLNGVNGTITVNGVLTIDNKNTGLRFNTASGRFVYQVFAENGDVVKYSGLLGALKNAEYGDKITLVQSKVVDESFTVPEGVTLVIPARIVLAVGSTSEAIKVTVNGEIQMERSSYFIKSKETGTTPVTSGLQAVTMVINGSVVKDDTAVLDGNIVKDNYAEFTGKIDGRSTTYYSNITYAGMNATEGTVTIYGQVVGDEVYFTKGITATDNISIVYDTAGRTAYNPTSINVRALYINGVTMYVPSSSTNAFSFTGAIIAPDEQDFAEIDCVSANGFYVETYEEISGTGTTDYLYLYTENTESQYDGLFYGTMVISEGVVTVKNVNNGFADLTVLTSENASFAVAEDAVLVIPKDTLSVIGGLDEDYPTIINGTISISESSVVFLYTDVAGTIIVSDTIHVGAIATVNLTGSLIVNSTDDEPAAFNLSGFTIIGLINYYGKLIVGDAPNSLGESGTVVGPVNIDANSFILVYSGDISEAEINWNSATGESQAVYTNYYINDELFAIAIANSSNNVKLVKEHDPIAVLSEKFKLSGLDMSKVVATNSEVSANATYWYYDTDKFVLNTRFIGDYDAIYFKADAAVAKGTVSVGVGLALYIDGVGYDYVGGKAQELTVGAHIVSYELKNGYVGDNVVLTFNGKTVPVTASGALIYVTADMVEDGFIVSATGAEPYVPEPEPTPTPEEKSEWTVTTILLCVLVVLIAIMAVIVALRLNRN